MPARRSCSWMTPPPRRWQTRPIRPLGQARRARWRRRRRGVQRLVRAGRRKPQPVTIDPDWVFNIIYSSGTTGTPKGIVHTHGMRWRQYGQLDPLGYGPDAVTRAVDAALFQHHAGLLQPDARRRRHRGADEEVRRARLPRTSAEASRHPHHAGAGAVSPHHGAAGFRQLRSVVLRDEVLDLGAVRRRAEGRRAEALARRPDRILRHDRRRRHLRAAGARASRQAAHRRPADAGSRDPPDRRGRQGRAAGRDRRGRRPFAA